MMVNHNLFRKLVLSLSSPITFDERFKITLEPFFISVFTLLSFELDNFMFEVLY